MATARGHLDRTEWANSMQILNPSAPYAIPRFSNHQCLETISLADSRTFQHQQSTQKSHFTYGLYGPITDAMHFRCLILSNRMLGSLYRYLTLNKPQSCANNKNIYS
jgi:hypothetical protein